MLRRSQSRLTFNILFVLLTHWRLESSFTAFADVTSADQQWSLDVMWLKMNWSLNRSPRFYLGSLAVIGWAGSCFYFSILQENVRCISCSWRHAKDEQDEQSVDVKLLFWKRMCGISLPSNCLWLETNTNWFCSIKQSFQWSFRQNRWLISLSSCSCSSFTLRVKHYVLMLCKYILYIFIYTLFRFIHKPFEIKRRNLNIDML